MKKIDIQNLYKIFGPHPERAMKLVKDGCSKGACGTCTVIIDGKSKKACALKVSKLEGRAVTTVEGLSDREKEIYDFAHCA